MRTFVTLCTVTLSLTTIAQVVFELPSAMPVPGVHSEQGWEWDGTPITLPTTGTGVTWDLTAVLDAGGSRTVTDAAPAGTPGAADFPNATHANGEVLNGVTTWYYYRLDASDTLWLEGARFQNGDLYNCAPPNLYMFFPYAVSDFAESNTTCSFGGAPFPVNQGLVPVATGTLIYPGGTLTDVVMMRAYYYGVPGEYYWYHANNALRWFGSYDPGALLSLWASGSTGITGQNDMISAALYPLPADEAVFMDVPTSADLVHASLLDNAGRLLFTGKLAVTGDRIRLDVSALPPGQYVLRVEDANVVRLGRISVMR